jgi:hypothetical protein
MSEVNAFGLPKMPPGTWLVRLGWIAWQKLDTWMMMMRRTLPIVLLTLMVPTQLNTVGTGMDAVTTANMGFTVSIRDDSNLHLCMFYLRHCTRTPHTPNVALLDLDRVRGFHDQRKWEENFKKTTVEPVINDKDWPRALENIREFLVSILGDTRVPLAYVIQADHIVPLYATDPADTYLTVDQDMTYRAPYSGTIFRMTSAMFGITWPTSATHMNAGFMSSLRSK